MRILTVTSKVFVLLHLFLSDHIVSVKGEGNTSSTQEETLNRFLNSSQNPTCINHPQPVTGQAKLYGVVTMTLSAFLSLMSNAIIIHVTRQPRMRTTTNLLILNMAIGDLITCLSCFPALAHHTWTGLQWFGGVFGEITCRISMASSFIPCYVSLFSLLFITVDRFLAIKQPLKHKSNSNWLKYAILTTWSGSVLLSLEYPLTSCLATLPNGKIFCGALSSYATGILLSIVFLMSLVAMTTMYTIIGYILWTRKVPGDHQDRRQVNLANKTAGKATKMIIITLAAYIICWSGFLLSDITRFDLSFYPYAAALLFSNGFLNMCIYVWLNEKIRHEFRDLSLWNFCRKLKMLKRNGKGLDMNVDDRHNNGLENTNSVVVLSVKVQKYLPSTTDVGKQESQQASESGE